MFRMEKSEYNAADNSPNAMPRRYRTSRLKSSTPEMAMAVLQRAFFSGANVQNKPAAAVAICRRGGATAAYQTLNMIFEMMNMPVVTSQYWNIAYGRVPGEVMQDTEGMQTMRTLADNMAWLLKKIHADGNPDYPEREDWQGMNFIR